MAVLRLSDVIWLSIPAKPKGSIADQAGCFTDPRPLLLVSRDSGLRHHRNRTGCLVQAVRDDVAQGGWHEGRVSVLAEYQQVSWPAQAVQHAGGCASANHRAR